MRAQVEILAPAGSFESMIAAVNAGADAVYMGGSRFGARAYADNPEEDRFLEAIDYAHLHGCRLYMTVNTLVKERELEELEGFLRPYYERGLDAVIVQDLGVFDFIRTHFPDLPVHASTQMTVTGWRSAKQLKEMGASRVVTARELSLEEIAAIRDHVDIEIESFVHGALCYCYSGQCLLSSLIGGRSGNRGRCAQPCRLPYDVQGNAGKKQGTDRRAQRPKAGDDRYVLSLKDLCTLDILPDIIESGVYSLKIEGRMKSPRYTAGVVSIYRKYVDRYLTSGRKGYRVDPKDRSMLLDLFDRGGFTDGYYTQHNGRDMVALKEKPAFREGNQALFDRLDAEYVNMRKQEPVYGHVVVREGEPARLTLSVMLPGSQAEKRTDGNGAEDGVGWSQTGDGTDRIQSGDESGWIRIEVTGEAVQTAQNQPLTEEKLLKQMNKTGGSPFYFQELTGEVQGACFMPVQALNQLRRSGMEQLEAAILGQYRRTAEPEKKETVTETVTETVKASEVSKPGESARCTVNTDGPSIHVSLEDPAGFKTVLRHREADAICLDSTGFGAETWKDAVCQCHREGKQCMLVLPHIFRREAEQYFMKHQDKLRNAGFDGFVVRSMEEPEFLRQLGLGEVPVTFDSDLYVMNHRAAAQMQQLGASRLTLPLELNSRELEELSAQEQVLPWEMVAYGHYPAMVSAQCIVRTTKGCTRQPELLKLKDRTGAELPVRNHCRFCYNTIYNPNPLSLLGQEKAVKQLHPAAIRLVFTVETPDEIRAVMDGYADRFRYGKDTPSPVRDFTRGHFRRGVE